LLTNSDKVPVHALPVEIINGNNHFETVVAAPVSMASEIASPVKKEIHLKDTAAKAEYDAILNALELVNFNKTKAANLLNIDRKTLYNKIRSYESNQANSVN